MSRLLAPILLLCTIQYAMAQCETGTAKATLDINNVKAILPNGGDLWTNFDSGGYFVPKNDPASHFFAAGITIAGIDQANNFCVSSVLYRNIAKSHFFPGPIDNNGQAPIDCSLWDKIWSIDKQEIDRHIEDSRDGTIDDPISEIYAWPGVKNPHSFDYNGFSLDSYTNSLAPYIDTNGDGIYNPADGDYPDIKGDQAHWWVVNDIGGERTQTNALPLHAEVHFMAYAYKSDNKDINNSSLYDITVFNRQETPLKDLRFSLWADIDLGCDNDDLVGTDTINEIVFAYNVDGIDGYYEEGLCFHNTPFKDSIPLTGIAFIDHPEGSGLSSSLSFFRNLEYPIISNTALASYYNLSGFWADGTPQTNGGFGYNVGSTDVARYCFPGNPSMNQNSDWYNCTTTDSLYLDPRILMNTEKDRLMPGERMTYTIAVMTSYDVTYPCPDVSVLGDISQKLRTINPTTVASTEKTPQITISPNPTRHSITINGLNQTARYNLYTSTGHNRLSGSISNGVPIDISTLENGLYFLTIKTERQRWTELISKY